VKIFNTPYGKAFISKVNSFATDMGTIVLPDWSTLADKGSFSVDELDQLFAEKVHRSTTNLLCYPKSSTMDEISSVLS